jgi:hypothetical protein
MTFVSCSRFFKEIAPEMADFDSPFDTLAILAEVVSSDDEMLSLGKRKCFCLLGILAIFLCFIYTGLFPPAHLNLTVCQGMLRLNPGLFLSSH